MKRNDTTKKSRYTSVMRMILVSTFSLILLSELAAAEGVRSIIRYRSAQQIAIHDKVFEMTGFRFHGRNSHMSQAIFGTANESSRSIIDFTQDAIVNTRENWYGVFAAANRTDGTVRFVMTPFLRVGSVNGNLITFMKGGEGVKDISSQQTYNWKMVLKGTKLLVISETIDNRANAFSGRITEVLDNSSSSMNIESVGSIGPMDYLLIAPPGYECFRYLGSFYMDTEEVRNLADTGTLVKAKMINLGVTEYLSGAGSRELRIGGYVSPLATAVVLDTTTYLQTTSGGDVAHYYGIDHTHIVQSTYYKKSVSTTDVVVDSGITIPFMFSQTVFFNAGGTLANNRDYVVFSVTGWIEP